MSGGVDDVLVLLDHDNISPKYRFPRPLALAALAAIPIAEPLTRVTLRVYGGWFEETAATDSRYEASAFYQSHCPIVIKTETHLIRLRFEFADALATRDRAGRRIDITHTVSQRQTAGQIASKRATPACPAPSCELSSIRRWFRKRAACTATDCPLTFDQVFARREQKQVDVHLSTDLVFYSSTLAPQTAVAVASDDLDVVPALLAAGATNAGRLLIHLRSPSRRPTYQDILLEEFGVRILTFSEAAK
jgi:hypothetical protein